MNKQETLEEVAERLYPISKGGSMWMPSADDCNKANKQEGFIEGAKWQKNDCVQFINKLEDESFDGWSKEAISGYLTACMTIKQKYIDTLNGN